MLMRVANLLFQSRFYVPTRSGRRAKKLRSQRSYSCEHPGKVSQACCLLFELVGERRDRKATITFTRNSLLHHQRHREYFGSSSSNFSKNSAKDVNSTTKLSLRALQCDLAYCMREKTKQAKKDKDL